MWYTAPGSETRVKVDSLNQFKGHFNERDHATGSVLNQWKGHFIGRDHSKGLLVGTALKDSLTEGTCTAVHACVSVTGPL